MAKSSRRLWCVLGGTSALIGLAFAQTPDPQGRVTSVYHDVQVMPAEAAPRTAQIDDTLDQGNALRTGNDSRSEITFADLTITRLGENTIFTVNKAGRSVHLDSGTILLYAKKNSGNAEISTKAVTVGITGTTVIFRSEAANFDRLLVLEGHARFLLNDYPDQTTTVRAGEILNVKAGSKKLPKPSHVDLRRILQTHELIKNFPPLPSLDLIYAAMKAQNPSASLPPRSTITNPPRQVTPQTNVNTPPATGGSGNPIPTGPTRLPSPTPAPTAITNPRATPWPSVRPIGTPRRPKYPPKISPTPKKRWPHPTKRPTATATPGKIIP
ncbi:MAG TPA: FecR domain-containing protein [Chthoniobacterales bacterium]|jgi:hypothetical protein|nr:FecR domain-containing protein [Chthoniobacterales bacterium]